MNWKHDIKLSDIPADDLIEATCRSCRKVRTETVGELLTQGDFAQFYMDEVERELRCHDRFCRGKVRLAWLHHDKIEGFVGGMP